MTQAAVSVVIPAYLQGDLTCQCLLSLAETAPADTEVLLVDNGYSLDPEGSARSRAWGERLFGERFIHLPQAENRNFSGACNIGARAATGRRLCLLNNDTTHEPGWLDSLLYALNRDPSLDAVGPLLLYPPSPSTTSALSSPFADKARVQHLGVTLSPDMKLRHLYEHFPARHRVVTEHRRFAMLTAAALLLDRSLYLDLGGMDEEFRNGFEDVEFCKRLAERRQRLTPGSPPGLACVPDAVVWHLCGQSPGRSDAETHNSAVLAQRGVQDFFTPDEHQYLAKDGYEIRLTPWLTWQPSLPARQTAHLRRYLDKAANHTQLRALLEEEPLWLEGWERLITLETDPETALATALRAERFDTGPAPLRHIRRLALLLGKNELARQAEQGLPRYDMTPEDKLRRLRATRAMLRVKAPELVPETERLLAAK